MSTDHGRLDGKIAIVTGGTQGLGATIARIFAERGAEGIVICGRNEAKGKAKAAEISAATGTRVVYVKADLGKVEDAQNVVHACDEAFGRVDALVNAAAITDRGTILDTSPELFDAMFAVNVRAPFFLMQETVKIMRREKIEVDNEALDEEFNQTLTALTMQGMDLRKVRGGRRGQQRVAQAVAMTAATAAIWSERQEASTTCWLFQALSNQRNERPSQVAIDVPELKA